MTEASTIPYTPYVRLIPRYASLVGEKAISIKIDWRKAVVGCICLAGLIGSVICILTTDASIPNVITVAAGLAALLSGVILELFGALQSKIRRPTLLELVGRVARVFVLVLAASGIAIGFLSLGHPSSLPLDSESGLKVGFIVAVLAIAFLALLTCLKHYAIQGAASRYTLLNEVRRKVERIIQGANLTPGEKRSRVVRVCLRALIVMFKTGVSIRVRDLFYFGKPYATAVSAFHIVPGAEENAPLSFAQYALPDKATQAQRPPFDWLVENHHPAALDREKFENKKSAAKDFGGKEWKRRFLEEWTDRHESVSAAGWVSATKETLYTNDASTCLAFESKYYQDLKQVFPDPDTNRRWIQIRAFIACAIDRQSPQAEVLWVCSTSELNFMPDDLHILELMASMIESAYVEIEELGK